MALRPAATLEKVKAYGTTRRKRSIENRIRQWERHAGASSLCGEKISSTRDRVRQEITREQFKKN
jgi:hypothetical protein